MCLDFKEFSNKVIFYIIITLLFYVVAPCFSQVPAPIVHFSFESNLDNSGSIGDSLFFQENYPPVYAAGVNDKGFSLNLSHHPYFKVLIGDLPQGQGGIKDALNQAYSYTVCMWIKTAEQLKSGSFIWQRRLAENNQNKVFSLSLDEWSRPIHSVNQQSGGVPNQWWAATGEWFLVAVSYDGLSSTDNQLYYTRRLSSSASSAFINSNPAGILDSTEAPLELMSLNNRYDILIDEVRVFASKTDSSGALTQSQLDEIFSQDKNATPTPVNSITVEPNDPFNALVYLPFDGDFVDYGTSSSGNVITSLEASHISLIVPDGGVKAGCLDLRGFGMGTSGLNVKLGYDGWIDSNISNAMNGLKSFTITGWFNTGEANSFVSSYTGLLGRLGQLLLRSYDSSGHLVLTVNSQTTPTSDLIRFTEDNQWIFWAVSYDGTKSTNNVKWYKATLDSGSFSLISTQSISAGSLSAVDKALSIGSLFSDGTYCYSGLIDEFRLFGSKIDSSGAINENKIRDIYEYAFLSPDYTEKMAGDSNYDCIVNFDDLTKLCYYWLETDKYFWHGNFDDSESIDYNDFSLLASNWLNEKQELYSVTNLSRVFPDTGSYNLISPNSTPIRLEVPKGVKAPFQFVFHSPCSLDATLSVDQLVKDQQNYFVPNVNIFKLLNVHAETNSNGCSNNFAGRPLRPGYEAFFVRQSPFDMAEALEPVENGPTKISGGDYVAFVVDIEIPTNVTEGLYEGTFEVETQAGILSCPFEIFIYDIVIDPNIQPLAAIHQLSYDPEDLVLNSEVINWWSQQHFDLIQQAAQYLYDYGDTSFLMPYFGENPLVNISLVPGNESDPNNYYQFDFTDANNFMQMFFDIGYETFEGVSLCAKSTVLDSNGEAKLRPATNVYAFDPTTNQDELIFGDWDDLDTSGYQEFLGSFYLSFNTFLQQKGWADKHYQQLCGEPQGRTRYQILSEQIHSFMPQVRVLNEISDWTDRDPWDYADLIDAYVFRHTTLYNYWDIKTWRENNGFTENWFYNCCWPMPSYINRFLDQPLCLSRVFPISAYVHELDGYHFWAANRYRDSNPYQASIAPLPGGSADPGHSLGDGWVLYPSDNGLLPSMRMLSFREGLVDFLLLKMLSLKDKQTADLLANTVYTNALNYEYQDDSKYYLLRKTVLEELSSNP